MREPQMRAALSLLDQALLSLTTFATTVLLARTLSTSEFGTFALLWSTLIILQGVPGSLIWRPVRVTSASYASGALFGYLCIQQRFNALLSLLLLPPLALAIYRWAPSILMFVGLATAFAGVVFHELARAAGQSLLRMERVFLGDSLGSLLRMSLLALLAALGGLSLIEAFAAIGVGGLAASLLAWPRLRRATDERLSTRTIAAENWKIGRWLLIESLLSSLSMQLFIIAAGWMLGPASVAGLAAVQQLLRLPQPLVLGAVNWTTSLAAHRLKEAGVAGWRESYLRTAVWLIPSVAGIVLIASISGQSLLALIYGEAYRQYAPLVPIFGGVVLLTAANGLLGSMLLSARQPALGLPARALATAASLTTIWPLLHYLDMLGAALGLLLTQLIWLFGYLYAVFVQLPRRTTIASSS